MRGNYPPQYYPRKRSGAKWLLILVIVAALIFYANSKGIIHLDFLNFGNFSFSGNQSSSPQDNMTISVNGMNQVQTVDYPNKKIILNINGQYENITVTKNTIVLQININGIYNTVNLCEGISPQTSDNGQGNQIKYQSC